MTLANRQKRQDFLDSLIQEKVMAQLGREEKLGETEEYRTELKKFKDDWHARAYRNVLLKTIADVGLTSPVETQQAPIRMQVMVSRILVRSLKDAEQAQKLLKMGQPFAKVAQKMSIDKVSAKKGGQIGGVVLGQQEPAMDQALARLNEGQISPIIKTAEGFQILQRGKTQLISSPTAVDVAKIRTQNNYLYERVQEARKTMKVEIDYAVLETLIPASSQ